jgi:hypothetical protein
VSGGALTARPTTDLGRFVNAAMPHTLRPEADKSFTIRANCASVTEPRTLRTSAARSPVNAMIVRTRSVPNRDTAPGGGPYETKFKPSPLPETPGQSARDH